MTCVFVAACSTECKSWVEALAQVTERNLRVVANARRAVLCFLVICRYRRQECEHVGAASKDAAGQSLWHRLREPS
jgi:hypothetical protein